MSDLVCFKQTFDRFMHSFVANNSDDLMIEFDPEWPSYCYQADGQAGEQVPWQPVLREHAGDFTDLESALECAVPAQLKVYYGRYWSDNIDTKTERGSLQLLQPFNQQDFERLQQNLIGHVLMKRRLKQADTWFFALTDEEDYILSVKGDSGAVMLERVGLPPQEELAASLSDFIQTLLIE